MTQKIVNPKSVNFFHQINTKNTDNCESGKKLVPNLLFANIYILHFVPFSLQNVVLLSGLNPIHDWFFRVAHG